MMLDRMALKIAIDLIMSRRRSGSSDRSLYRMAC